MTDNEQDFNMEDNPSEDSPEKPMERFFFHQKRALEETGKALEALLPPEFRKHGTEASKEFAKGFRVLVDATIDNLKKVSEKDDPDAEDDMVDEPVDEPIAKKDNDDDDDDPPSTTGKTKVKVKLD